MDITRSEDDAMEEEAPDGSNDEDEGTKRYWELRALTSKGAIVSTYQIV